MRVIRMMISWWSIAWVQMQSTMAARTQPMAPGVHSDAESKVFAQAYSEFRIEVMGDIETRKDARYPERFKSRASNLAGIRQDQEDWKRIARRIEDSSYTVFLDNTDPGRSSEYTQEDWFDKAMGAIQDSMYHRYSPEEGEDPYPTGPIHSGLMLGRFLYEHLFPVSLDAGWSELRFTLT